MFDEVINNIGACNDTLRQRKDFGITVLVKLLVLHSVLRG